MIKLFSPETRIRCLLTGLAPSIPSSPASVLRQLASPELMQDSGGVSDREMPTDAEDDSSSRREPLSSVTPAELDHHPRGASQRKSWTAQEDAELTRIVHELGARRWEKVALQMPGRMGKRCRERWFKKAQSLRRTAKASWLPGDKLPRPLHKRRVAGERHTDPEGRRLSSRVSR